MKTTPEFCENEAEKRMLHIEGFSLREVMLSRTKGCSKITLGNIYKNQAQAKWITWSWWRNVIFSYCPPPVWMISSFLWIATVLTSHERDLEAFPPPIYLSLLFDIHVRINWPIRRCFSYNDLHPILEDVSKYHQNFIASIKRTSYKNTHFKHILESTSNTKKHHFLAFNAIFSKQKRWKFCHIQVSNVQNLGWLGYKYTTQII